MSVPAGEAPVNPPVVVDQEERDDAEQSAKLGPMLPEEYREARRIFLEDLAAR